MESRRGRRYAAGMRVAALLLTACCWAADGDTPRPLAADSAQAYQALMALTRGEAAEFEALPAEVFTRAAAAPDDADPALERRWTRAIPAAIQRLPADRRPAVVAALDRRFALLAAGLDADARARLAVDFLPAPAATAAVAGAADRAFDRGDFPRYLALAALLARPLDADRRSRVALELTGAGPEIDAALRLAPPGVPEPTAARPLAAPPGLSVRWALAPGRLLACDPWGRPLWQFRLEHRAVVVTGAGGALVRDSQGLRLLGEDGAIAPLPPPPPDARLLAVAGGAAWFATGRIVHRLDLADRTLASHALPAEPLAPPLVRGPASLWLTAEEVVLLADDRLHRVRHGLPADAGWTLGAERALPLVLAPDGRGFRLAALDEQLAGAVPRERLRLLLAARRPAEAWALFAGDPALAGDPAARALALRAVLAGGLALPDGLAAALPFAEGPQAHAELLAAAWHAADAARRPELAAQLAAWCAAHPDVRIDRAGDGGGEPAETWSWMVAGRAWSDAPSSTHLDLPARRRVVAATAVPAPPPPVESRAEDGSHRWNGRRFRIEPGLATTTITCSDEDGALRWRRNWPAPSVLDAPGCAVAFRDGTLVVIEGAQRITVLDAATGALRARERADAEVMPQQIVPLADGTLAALTPFGLHTTLLLVRDDTTTVIRLPTPARWIAPWQDGVVAVLDGGRAVAYPSTTPITLPADLAAGAQPQATPAGLARDGMVWGWSGG